MVGRGTTVPQSQIFTVGRGTTVPQSQTSFTSGLQDAGQFGVATGRRGFNRTSFNKSTSAPYG